MVQKVTPSAEGTVADDATAGAIDAIDDVLGLGGDDEAAGSDDSDSGSGDSGDDEDSDESGSDGEGEEGYSEGEESDESEGDDEASAESEFNADGTRKERNPDGTFKKPDDKAKAKDPINDPLPKDLKVETKERIQSLIQTAKTLTTERDEARQSMDTFVNGIQSTGASPEQYGETLSWLSLFNSPKPEARMEAYKLVKNVAERMATMLGIEHTASNPLEGHADLIAEVNAKQITPARAAEIARTRNAAKFNTEINTGVQTRQQQQDQAQREHAQAKTDLNAFEQEMMAKDGELFRLKRDAILPSMQIAFKRIPKNQWAQTFKDAYAAVKLQPKGPAAKTNGKKPQPLRGGKQPAGGHGKAAGSALDAVNAALGAMK